MIQWRREQLHRLLAFVGDAHGVVEEPLVLERLRVLGRVLRLDLDPHVVGDGLGAVGVQRLIFEFGHGRLRHDTNVSPRASQRHGLGSAGQWTPPRQRSMPLSATWSARPREHVAAGIGDGDAPRPQVDLAGPGSTVTSGTRAEASRRRMSKKVSVAQERPRFVAPESPRTARRRSSGRRASACERELARCATDRSRRTDTRRGTAAARRRGTAALVRLRCRDS